ncbi:hypothetical protein [Oscillibacter sp.]|uniref:hypothetical protein n=1 Tax=Oscillibacter sp. TaxID=1945593 RepID=UPI00339567B2
MTDGSGRTIRYLRPSVTNLCNCRCRYEELYMTANGSRLPHSSDRRYLRGEHQSREHRFEAPAAEDHLRIGNSEVAVTQIGKECHSDCAVKKAVGKCVMPTEGIFAVVMRE